MLPNNLCSCVLAFDLHRVVICTRFSFKAIFLNLMFTKNILLNFLNWKLLILITEIAKLNRKLIANLLV